jgi:hypothetical protein
VPIIRRHKHARRDFNVTKRHELLTGEIDYPMNSSYAGYADGHSTNLEDYISDEMRDDWQKHRGELLEFWRSGNYYFQVWRHDPVSMWQDIKADRVNTLPWAAEQFDEGT